MALIVGKVFTVAPGATLSTTNDLGIVDGTAELVGFWINGTVLSATMTFNVSFDGVTFKILNTESGSAVSVTIASNTMIGLKQDVRAQLGRWRYVQLVMASSETAGASVQALVK